MSLQSNSAKLDALRVLARRIATPSEQVSETTLETQEGILAHATYALQLQLEQMETLERAIAEKKDSRRKKKAETMRSSSSSSSSPSAALVKKKQPTMNLSASGDTHVDALFDSVNSLRNIHVHLFLASDIPRSLYTFSQQRLVDANDAFLREAIHPAFRQLQDIRLFNKREVFTSFQLTQVVSKYCRPEVDEIRTRLAAGEVVEIITLKPAYSSSSSSPFSSDGLPLLYVAHNIVSCSFERSALTGDMNPSVSHMVKSLRFALPAFPLNPNRFSGNDVLVWPRDSPVGQYVMDFCTALRFDTNFTLDALRSESSFSHIPSFLALQSYVFPSSPTSSASGSNPELLSQHPLFWTPNSSAASSPTLSSPASLSFEQFSAPLDVFSSRPALAWGPSSSQQPQLG